ncbi:hypothetical protein KSP40_PGU022271 [Platanthera guangdongensis]|uniref:Uncharacterized protein n=1 Tax=Platanthera guangdongensis TaxID=2320717 RepID=A0ABR2MA27_9ASPA
MSGFRGAEESPLKMISWEDELAYMLIYQNRIPHSQTYRRALRRPARAARRAARKEQTSVGRKIEQRNISCGRRLGHDREETRLTLVLGDGYISAEVNKKRIKEEVKIGDLKMKSKTKSRTEIKKMKSKSIK